MSKEFLTDLRNDKIESTSQRAVMLQILCVNRPINTVVLNGKI